ncbi:MAG: helix-turn-helix domain-containing protein [Clostridiales bacterium]|jgi:sugar diacid utilization regulator|nr:helix-turn-helix domain-containing protein [Eubacteriales bacterium]MDH7566545.1 helix-turn-helix domain-containing protein [Clostridiales bacterium]
MKTNINFLTEILAPFQPVYIQIKSENTNISAIKFLSETQSTFEPDILYVARGLMDPGIFSDPYLLNIICMGSVPLQNNDSWNPKLNLIVLKEDVDIYNVFNAIQAALSKEQQLDFWSSRFISSLASAQSLQDLIDTGYEMLGNPIYISDVYGKCIGMTNNVDVIDDIVWNELSTSGYISHDTFVFNTKNNLAKMIDNSDEPFIWHDSYTKSGKIYRKIFRKIKIEDKHRGTVAIVEYNKPFNEYDLKLASLFCDVVSAYLQENELLDDSIRKMYESIIVELLSEKIISKEIMEEKRKMLNFQSKATLCAVSIDLCMAYEQTELTLTNLSRIIEKKITNSKAIVYNNIIFLLLSSNNKKYFFEKELKILEEFIKGRQIQVGVSRLFHKFEYLYQHYIQSVKALELGKKINKEKQIYLYDDYSVYHIIEDFLTKRDFFEFCHPSLLALIEYDKQNNTTFTHTLYTYINSSKSISDTSNILNIHRNTVIYQIKKISDITNIDFENSNVILQLQISFKMLELYKAKQTQIT